MTLEEIYARIPKVDCKKLCRHYCGPVPLGSEETKRIVKAFGSVPKMAPDMSCGLLCQVTGTCNAYDARPFICRLWGTVRSLACPHGCQPDHWLSEAEERKLISDYRKIEQPDVEAML